ncbi:NUDIX hydrolase [Ferruginibacter yonginensis]|uniref:GDP-mannose pyrophosphatase n=1 Tax=Ferruginibacter yonginensis TaxID=1310416 RepID=A0ABV8QRV7_9BACT
MSIYKIISSTYISEHPYFTARKDAYETPTGKVVDPYYVVEMPDSAAAVAITHDQQIILIEQYRHPIQQTTLELPGGFIDGAEAPIKAIARELLEETGHQFSQIYSLGTTYANPGVLNNATHLFLAIGGVKVAQQQLDANEEINITYHTVATVKNMLQTHTLIQSMHEVALRRAFDFMASL